MTRTERTYYVVNAGWCLAWGIAPIYPLFLRSRGLDLFEANVVLAVFLATAFLFEVPTGAVADVVGRKASFLLACLVRTAAFTLYAFADGFRDCVIAEFFDAIGQTLASGALDAWAVDGIRADGDHRPPDRVFARAQTTARAVMVASAIVFAGVADRGLYLIWYVGAACFALTGIIAAVVMHEPGRGRVPWHSAHRSLARTVVEGFDTARGAPVMLVICGLTMLIGFVAMPVNMLWPQRLQAISGEGYWLLGWIWAILSLSIMMGGTLAQRLVHASGRAYLLVVSRLLRGIGLLVAALATRLPPATLGLAVSELGTGMGAPSLDAWLNEHIAAERRATVLSVNAMCFTLGGAAGLLVQGLIARSLGISIALVVAASIAALTAPGFVLLARVARRVEDAVAVQTEPEPLAAS